MRLVLGVACMAQCRRIPKEEDMTLRRSVVVSLLLAGFAINVLSQSAPTQSKSAESPLAPVAWLVGGTWVSDVKGPGDGTVTHVENHIAWSPNHQAIQFVTDFNGKPHYNGMYAYDPAKKAINFYYTSESGQLTIGTTTPDSDGKTLRQEFDIMSPNGKTDHVRSTLVRDGNDAYLFSVFEEVSGDWKQLFQITYKRTM
jgi:hypothetical protein